jgi:hypothetical protein
MKWLMLGVVCICLVLSRIVPVSASVSVNGPPVPLVGYVPNPTDHEYPTYISPNGQFMLVHTSANSEVQSRTWTGTAWGPLTDVPGITGTGMGYNFATLSPDGKSLFTMSGGTAYIQRSTLQSDGMWSTPQTIVPGDNSVYPYFNGQQLFYTKKLSQKLKTMLTAIPQERAGQLNEAQVVA